MNKERDTHLEHTSFITAAVVVADKNHLFNEIACNAKLTGTHEGRSSVDLDKTYGHTNIQSSHGLL